MSTTETQGPQQRGSSESRRARETQRYIDSWTATSRLTNTATANPESHRYNEYRSISDASSSATSLVPLGGDDTSLSAFAQLATLRLNVKRCIISLLGIDREYILAESTRTISLQSDEVHAAADALWLGACSIPRSESLTSSVIDQWRGAEERREPTEEEDEYYTSGTTEHWLIASDVRRRPDLLSCSFVKYCPNLRFVAAIPIRTPGGKALGSLMIMDDIPRYGLSDAELVFLEDIADTVFGHLELKRAALARQRGDRLIKGLALFNEGKDSLREWWLENYSRNERGEGNRRRGSHGQDGQNLEDRADEELGMTYRAASDESKRYSGHSGSHSDHEREQSDPDRTEDAQNGDRLVESEAAGRATKEKDTHASDFNVSREISNVFARASNLIRESASADGVLFVEADMASPNDNRGRFRKGSQDMVNSSTESDEPENSDDNARRKSKDDLEDSPCSLLGFSTKVKSSVRGFAASPKHTTLPRSFIRRLIRRYPHGKVFTIRADGTSWSSGNEGTSGSSSAFSAVGVLGSASVKTKRGRTVAKLAEVFPDVQSVAFLPMWDSRRERWRSAAFVWSSFKKRLLESEEDLTYLLAFSNSILAELSRLDVVASDNAKATFIASVSHELRSPLHGILAGAEFLQETQLTLEQQEMARTVTLAGNTLLDTINHILDFAKINSFTDKQRKARVRNDVSRSATFKTADMGEVGVTGSVDLAVLTESVADTVVKAYQFQALSKQGASGAEDPVHFLLDIDVRPSWRLNLSPGSWTRLITNLVGNSFKYTKRGHIKLRLTATDEDDKKRSTLSLIVEDTGQGISQSYLQQYLYTPFMQENSHSSGTGLGLSIVKQITDEMGGRIDIQSEVGRGTSITIELKTRFLPARDDKNLQTLEAISVEAGQQGVTLGIVASQNDAEEDPDETEQSVLREEQDQSIRNVVSKTCSQWLHYEPQTIAKPQHVPVQQICMILDTDYRLLLSQQEKQGRMAGRTAKSSDQPRIIVLTTLPQFLGNDLWLDDRSASVVFVTQPFGPRKLSRVISTVLSENKMLENRRDLPTPGREHSEVILGAGSLPQSPSEHVNIATDYGSRPSTATRMLADDGNVSPSTTPVPSTTAGAQSGKILLVEDNEINMNLLVAMAKRLQRTYAVAYNGVEAVQEYSKNPASFVLVLMDMSMPIMDGFTATETIRNMESKNSWSRVRIVAVTGLGSNDARKQAFQSGVDDFMIKPATLKKLKGLIEAAT